MSDNPKSAIANAGNLIIPESDWYSFYYEQTSGIELESQAGVLGILEPAWYDFYYEQQQVVYATGSSLSSVEGQQLTSYIGEISATADNPVTWSSSGQIKRYPSNQFVSATAKIGGASSEFAIGDIQTSATTSINATISLNNVVSFVQASDINASGTLEISEEELILLLAA